ncbi:MAG TPA: FtsX-like permease family protein [Dehalococcoidia bacterium]|nr:FtsX-like permease family protein [Dehalococcoidia bacterium]
MKLLLSAWELVLRRSLANWRLLSSVLAGVVVAVALLASAPLYADALSLLGLAHQLQQRTPELLDVQVQVFNEPGQPDTYARMDKAITNEARLRLGPVLESEARLLRTAAFYTVDPDEADQLIKALEAQEQALRTIAEESERASQIRRELQAPTDAAVGTQSPDATAGLEKATIESKQASQAAFDAEARLDSALLAAEQATRSRLLAERALTPGNARRQQAYEDALKAEAATQEAVNILSEEARRATSAAVEPNQRLERARLEALASQEPALRRRVEDLTKLLNDTEARVRDENERLPALRLAQREVWHTESRDRGYLLSLTDLQKHVRLIEGAFPKPFLPADGRAGSSVEVLIDPATAQQEGLRVGSELAALPSWRDSTDELVLRVAGVVEPLDLNEEFWLNENPFLLDTPGPRDPEPPVTWQTVSFFVPSETILGGVAALFPAHDAHQFSWRFFIEPKKLLSLDTRRFENDLETLRVNTESAAPGRQLLTVLREELSKYHTKLLLTRVPVYLVLLQVVGVILYYLTMVGNMLVERRAADVALLQDRGASIRQILTLNAMEGVLLCGVAFIVGPFLAQSFTALLGKTATFQSLSGGGLLPVRLTPDVFWLAALAAVLAFFALLAPTFQLARRSLAAQRASLARPAPQAWWQRYNLDLLFLLLGGLLYWQVSRQGLLSRTGIFSELSFDPVQLLSPTLLVVATAIAFLRLFPLLLTFASRLFSGDLSATSYLGLLFLGRNSLPYTRLILLITLITAVGFFVALFSGTLGRSLRERTAYTTGADVRVARIANFEQGPGAFLPPFKAIAGVEEAMPLHRNSARLVGRRAAAEGVVPQVLALPRQAAAGIAFFRSDFSKQRLEELMGLLKPEPVLEGRTLLPSAVRLRLRVQAVEPCRGCLLYLRVHDSAGTYWDLEIAKREGLDVLSGAIASPEWRQYTVDLPAGSPPFTFIGFNIAAGREVAGSTVPAGSLRFDAIETVNASGAVTKVEDFESLSRWELLDRGITASPNTQVAPSDSFVADSANAVQGSYSGKWTWRAGAGLPALQVPRQQVPIPAIASSAFRKAANLSAEGQPTVSLSVGGRTVSVKIVGDIEYFPTLSPGGSGFIIVDLAEVSRVVNYLPGYGLYPNEVWISTKARGPAREGLLTELRALGTFNTVIYDEGELMRRATADPLASAGWQGVLSLAFLAVAGIGVLGFMVYAYMFAQRRQLEFAVLRTMGFSARQINRLVSFELALVVLVGIAVGSIIGAVMGSIILPFLQLTELGEQVLPPFVLTIGWAELIGICGILLAAFVIASAITSRFFFRLSITRLIRIGE